MTCARAPFSLHLKEPPINVRDQTNGARGFMSILLTLNDEQQTSGGSKSRRLQQAQCVKLSTSGYRHPQYGPYKINRWSTAFAAWKLKSQILVNRFRFGPFSAIGSEFHGDLDASVVNLPRP